MYYINNEKIKDETYIVSYNISNKINKQICRIYELSSPEYHYEQMHHYHGCGLYISGKLISYGTNSSRNYSRDKWIQGHSCHAEIDALRKFHKNYSNKYSSKKMFNLYSKMTLVIVRYNRDKLKNSISAPCVACSKKIKDLGIKTIIYCDETNAYRKIKTYDYETTHISNCQKKYNLL